MVLDNAEMIDARSFVRAHDIVNGNQKLNLAFVANLFNMYPAMDAVEGFEIIEETREEKSKFLKCSFLLTFFSWNVESGKSAVGMEIF